jgi:hypothetical protein
MTDEHCEGHILPEQRIDPPSRPSIMIWIFGKMLEAVRVILFAFGWVLVQVVRGIGWGSITLLLGFLWLGAAAMAFWAVIALAVLVYASGPHPEAWHGLIVCTFAAVLCLSLAVLIRHFGSQVYDAINRRFGRRNGRSFSGGIHAAGASMAGWTECWNEELQRSDERRQREHTAYVRQQAAWGDAQRADRAFRSHWPKF